MPDHDRDAFASRGRRRGVGKMGLGREQDEVRKAVRERYAGIAENGIPQSGSGCCGEEPASQAAAGCCGSSEPQPASSCCGTAAPQAAADQDEISRALGYRLEELAQVP